MSEPSYCLDRYVFFKGYTMNTITYNGYTAAIGYSSEDDCLVGCLMGITDIVGFHGDSVAKIKAAFEEAVDDHLEFCVQSGRSPQQPFTGEIELDIPPEHLHARLALLVEKEGKNLSDFVADKLCRYIDLQK